VPLVQPSSLAVLHTWTALAGRSPRQRDLQFAAASDER